MNMPDEKALRQYNTSLNLDPLWIPFTANRQFKSAPRLLVSAKAGQAQPGPPAGPVARGSRIATVGGPSGGDASRSGRLKQSHRA